MSDTGAGEKKEKKAGGGGKLKGWTPSVDGSSVSRVFALPNDEDAMKMARRALTMAHKDKTIVDLRFDGTAVTIRLSATNGVLSETDRKLARKVEPKTDEQKKAGAEKRAAKAAAGGEKPAKAAKPAKK